ncbi:2-aminoethanethiol dioxygenase [Centruroides vittatus]|uniref:2-aminoethanethiol dioxygenase n=1 Tax=Centruroides vittatus TaxID=120091 RepID=UPI0035100336
MASLVEMIARQAQQTFSRNFNEDVFVDCLAKLRIMLGHIKSSDVNLSRDIFKLTKDNSVEKSAPVTYVDLFENQIFSMGIFIVRNGARIPLHDHPGMYGLLKVLHGKVKIINYNRTNLNEKIGRIPREIIHKIPTWQRHLLLPSKRNEDIEVSTDTEPCVLTPTEGNLHEIHSVGGIAAFLDILAPPYMNETDCHYYQHVGDQDVNDKTKISWLAEISSPTDFWCDSIPYTGPNINLDQG